MEKFGTLEFVLDRYSGTWCWKISGNRAVNMVSKLIPRGWYGDKPDEVIVSDNDENIKKLKMIDERYSFELLSKSVWKRKIAPLTIKKIRVPKIEKLNQAVPSKQFRGTLLDFIKIRMETKNCTSYNYVSIGSKNLKITTSCP